MCCKIPLELKLQGGGGGGESTASLLPKGWYYTFDDPQLTSLVYSTPHNNNRGSNMLSFSGLKIITSYAQQGDDKKKKQKQVFHSLVSAFDSLVTALQHQQSSNTSGNDDDDDVIIINQATDMLINFTSHISSSSNLTINNTHFLIGKPYCIEFTTQGEGKNVVLFGTVITCLKQQQQQCTTNNINNSEDDEMFIVKYDKDALQIANHLINNTMGSKNNNNNSNNTLPKFQLLSTSQTYGGCISYERKSQMKKDVRYSTVQNVDQATPVETWVTPDLRYEGLVNDVGVHDDQQMQQQGDGEKLLLPQLTIFVRGYKFIFTVKKISSSFTTNDNNNENAKQQQEEEHEEEQQQYGVFVTCTTTMMTFNTNQEINLKPGELIDLGVFSPLHPQSSSSSGCGDDDDDCEHQGKKTLAAFIIKNYIHSYKPGKYGVTIATDDNYVYDITSDATGTLHEVAKQHVSSYVRCCNNKNKRGEGMVYPMIHTRCDPSGAVHLLFGIPYLGNWGEYEYGMSQLVPLLMGNNEIEVMTTSSRDGGGMLARDSSSRKKNSSSLGKKTKKEEEMDGKYLSSIGMFQTDDILSCNDQLGRMIYNSSENSSSSIQHDRVLVERSRHVVKCLEGRAKELLDMFTDAKQRSLTQKDVVSEGDDGSSSTVRMVTTCEEQAAILNSAIEQLRKLSVELDSCEQQQVLDMTVI